ncbi:unnamed protein product [Arctia plantaginis]|uniref:NADP-dependent oxidoreductase domain-containing protein n=1 Tax=Arctia plantaginis TaxID=874455 RepID=A0A8S0ZVU7_ARCPL|nr:unnamed protein product [Arctia plantaginis]
MVVFALILFTLLQGVMSSSIKVPTLKMLDGREMPALALGTYLGFDKDGVVQPKNKEIRDIALQAIDIGYRHFDTASVYGTEADIGEAIRMKIAEGVIKREHVFVTTKLWNTAHKPDQVLPAFMDSLNKTGLDYIDLYLMHWPIGLNEDNSISDVDYMETWRAMEKIQKSGLAKSIGVANFNKEQLRRVISEGSVKPVALQIEVHLQMIQTELLELCKSEGIIVQGYSPFGSLVMRFGFQYPGPKFDDPTLVSIAQKYGKTTAQVVLRWAVDRNVVPLPKTVSPKRLAENLNIFDFKLEPKEIEEINKFNSNTRYTLPSFWQENTYYPFEKVENPISDPFKS